MKKIFNKIASFFMNLFGSEPDNPTVPKKARTESSHSWSLDDAILTLYFYKFGVGKLGSVELIAHEYICSTADSLKMMAANIRYLKDIKSIVGDSNFSQTKKYTVPQNRRVRGLSHYSSTQREAIIKYDALSEPELRKIAQKIMKNKTKRERKQNLETVRNRRVVKDKNQLTLEI